MGDAGGSPERSSAYLSCQLNMERKSQIVDPDRRVAGETESLPSSMLRVDRTEQEALAAPILCPYARNTKCLLHLEKHLDGPWDVGSLATDIEAHLQIFPQPHMHSLSRKHFENLPLLIDAQFPTQLRREIALQCKLRSSRWPPISSRR
ncbi:hypothetical protein CCMA1212_004509 [Trichoderma ghanense]|uniref:Uncharacterized protein n=1 Tax=Trichoderma ghanense TaxID=65468 RepID=A0ABY2H4F3_9HYPO